MTATTEVTNEALGLACERCGDDLPDHWPIWVDGDPVCIGCVTIAEAKDAVAVESFRLAD